MPTVTNTIKRPDGTAFTSGRVVIELVGSNGATLSGGYVSASDYTIEGQYGIETLTNGTWSQSLVANSLINPAGTAWKITEQVDGRSHVYYVTVPTGAGPYFVEDILTDPPGTIASAALTTHMADTVDAHDASAVSLTSVSGLVATDVQAAIAELAAASGGSVPVSPWSYVILGAGTSTYTLYDSSGAVVATNTTPDIGPLLQTAMNALVANQVGGTIVLGPGKFVMQPSWTADLNDSGVNYTVYFPASVYWPAISIVGQGVSDLNHYNTGTVSTNMTQGTGGTEIFFNITANAPGGLSSGAFGSMANPNNFSNFNGVDVYIDGIRFTQASNQYNFTMLAMGRVSSFSFGRIAVDTYFTSTTMASPSSGNQALCMPYGNNQGLLHGQVLWVAGYRIGVAMYEHVVIDYYMAETVHYPINLLGSLGHANKVGRFNPQACPWLVWNQVSGGQLSIDEIDAETWVSLPSATWAQWQTVFVSSANSVFGEFGWRQVAAGDQVDTPGPLPPGVRWHYLGRPILPAPSVIVPDWVVLGTESGGTMTANEARYVDFEVKGDTVTIDRVMVHVTVQNGNICVAIYDSLGAGGKPGGRLSTSGSVACPAAGGQSVAIPTLVLPRGRYYVALSTNDATMGFGYITLNALLSASGTHGYHSSSSFPLPTTASGLTADSGALTFLMPGKS